MMDIDPNNITPKQLIDKVLEYNAKMFTQLGKEDDIVCSKCGKSKRDYCKIKERRLLEMIRPLDPDFIDRCLAES